MFSLKDDPQIMASSSSSAAKLMKAVFAQDWKGPQSSLMFPMALKDLKKEVARALG